MASRKDKPTVLVTEECYRRGKEVYDSVKDFEIVTSASNEAILAAKAKDKNAFAVILGPDTYSGPLYEEMNKGGVIARFGVGYDGINFQKAENRGLLVTNTPGVLETTVAELTVFLAGEILRGVGEASKELKNGIWNPVPGRELQGKTWAILGLGKIGKKVSNILSFGFGVTVYALKKNTSNSEKIKRQHGVEKLSSDYAEIAPHADIVSLHLPANENTHRFMNRSRLERLKSGAILINTARGALVDENALYDLLKDRHLSGAGLDVFGNEPYQPIDVNKDLRKLPGVVLTPHIGSNAKECSRRMTERVLQNIRFALEENYEQMDLVTV